jgi:1-aminocyclopropane-1-carboxylate deaminase/D-cysteine desulfhydrase-like pyridoxal-dependent ACC family enzyme
MCDLVSKNELKGSIVYLNTGGFPALFAEKAQVVSK